MEESMKEQDEIDTPESGYSEEDLAKIRQLRNYYRRRFHNGVSDGWFMTWLDGGLRVIDQAKDAPGGPK
jgi:hypothetical protein